MCKKYQGYSNYPTWAYCLWADNEEGSYNYHISLARSAMDLTLESLDIENLSDLEEKDKHSAINDMKRGLADALYSEFEESKDHIQSLEGVLSDIMTWAIERIDWYEVASHYADYILDD
mgnify:CR=1 FL=1